MIRTLRGKFYPQTDGTVVIESSSGIGFLLTVPVNSPLFSKAEGEEVKTFTLLIVREDDMSLYGFDSMEELNLFRQLLSVNGIGAKAGMAIMGILPCQELKKSICEEQVDVLTQAPGIGKRTAQRVVLELKDKIEYTPGTTVVSKAVRVTNERKSAIEALVALGYSRSEATDALALVEDENLTEEQYIKRALRNML